VSLRVALKIDVDTYRGTRDGVPALLEDLAAAKVRASFFFSVGPDRSGRAIFRIFRKRGFLAKMLRTNAPAMYGWRTMLYGTLLPAPRIGKECAAAIRAARDAGHEVGLHAWDHVRWQDDLDRLSPAEVRADLAAGMDELERILGQRPRAFAAPAWHCTADAFAALDDLGLEYTSITRGDGPPFLPEFAGRRGRTLELPTTLPTLDELLGRDGVTVDSFNDRLLERYRPGATEVLTVHAETEGLGHRALFRDLLRRHAHLGVETLPLETIVAEARRRSGPPPVRAVTAAEIPGRAGPVMIAEGP
jgi:undecaprenyl phosphate-alpha-L-ara4FN deformylase